MEAGTEAEATKEWMLRTDFLSMHCLACFICLFVYYIAKDYISTVGWALSYQPLIKKIPHMLIHQYGEDIFLIEVFPSSMTLAYVNLMKN